MLVLSISVASYADFNEIKQKFNDTIITTIIKSKITKDSNLNPLSISVATKGGIVTLKGRVNNNQSFVDVLRAATSTKGVKSINASDLEIKHVNSTITDAYITAKIEAAILEAKVIDDDSIPLVGINASTKNGVVTISGSVKSAKSIAAILKRINNIKGVKKIISNLEIESSDNVTV